MATESSLCSQLFYSQCAEQLSPSDSRSLQGRDRLLPVLARQVLPATRPATSSSTHSASCPPPCWPMRYVVLISDIAIVTQDITQFNSLAA